MSDDPTRSLRVPRDLVPVKPSVDVILVGSAFAPERRPARSVVARLVVGDIDKSIEVNADRALGPDGSLREGQPFTQLPLVYERAAGGPGTWNPVGMRKDARDAAGCTALPNLQKPGTSWQGAFEPIGFGPIAPSWPERRDRLGGATWSFRDLGQRPLPEGMDLAYFNAAPRDQQVRALGDRARLTLENLHPEYATLVTSLPAAAPRALLEGRHAGPQAITLRADTLWIDTDRGMCAVTFRGTVPLEGADERGRVVVSMDGDPSSTGEASGVYKAPRRYDMTADIATAIQQVQQAALPFAPSAPAPPSPVMRALEPASLAAPSGPAGASPWSASPRPTEAPAITAPPVLSRAPAISVVDAESAASPQRVAPSPLRRVMDLEPAPAARVEAREAVELVWFDAESVPRIRRKAPWRPLLEALERTPLDPDFDDPALAKDPLLVEDRREVFEILARAEPTGADGLYEALTRCLREDGKFVPTLTLVAGELELPFDELAALRATLTTVAPLAGSDETLKSALEAAKDFLGTPGLMSAPAVAEALTKRIEDAFAQGKRVVAAGYLEAQRERALVEHRQYQRRPVFGGKHLRALLDLGEGEASPALSPASKPGAPVKAGRVPVYLPEHIAELLPLYARFRARLIAEIRLPADRYETHPIALRVLALARTTAPPRR